MSKSQLDPLPKRAERGAPGRNKQEPGERENNASIHYMACACFSAQTQFALALQCTKIGDRKNGERGRGGGFVSSPAYRIKGGVDTSDYDGSARGSERGREGSLF